MTAHAVAPAYSLRPSTGADSGFIHRVRNDPLTRAQSRRTHEIPQGETNLWRPLIFCAGGLSLGYGRCAEDGELSWAIAPEHRGRGHAKALIRLLMSQTHGDQSFACIKPDNDYCKRAARSAGMVLNEIGADGLEIWGWGFLRTDV